MRLNISVSPPQWAHPRKRTKDPYRFGHPEKRCFFGPDFLPVCEKTHFFWCPELYMGWISKRLKKKTLFFRGLAPFLSLKFALFCIGILAPKGR